MYGVNFMRMRYLAVTGIVVVLLGSGCSSIFDSRQGHVSTSDASAVPIQHDPSWHALRVERLPANPIITPAMLPANDGDNIDGPSLIRVPVWVQNPLGKYYLYFAHHLGQYIRLAYADKIDGPWKVYKPGTLKLQGTVCDSISNPAWAKRKHIASPDVHVEERSREIRMYFHCPAYIGGSPKEADSYKQVSFVATSRDGLHFEVQPEKLGHSLGKQFFRVFQWAGAYYALAKQGALYRSPDGLHGFVQGPVLFTKEMRHTAVMVHGDTLLVFYSVIGDNPESILLSSIPLGTDWKKWTATAPRVVLKPEREWEGSSLPPSPPNEDRR